MRSTTRMHSCTLGRGIATLEFVHRDDTPADDLLVADLRDRLDRASVNSPLLGTVELALIGQSGPLADTIGSILRKG